MISLGRKVTQKIPIHRANRLPQTEDLVIECILRQFGEHFAYRGSTLVVVTLVRSGQLSRTCRRVEAS